MIETHELGAGVAGGVEGPPDIAGAMAAGGPAAQVPAHRHDLVDAGIVPFLSAAERVAPRNAGRSVTNEVYAGVTG